MKNIILVLGMLFTCAVVADEDPYKKMNGIYFIWGDFIKDKPPKKLDGFSLFIDGDAAKRMYSLIQNKAYYNECYDDGTLTKSKGNFECNLSLKGNHSCNLGVDLDKQKIYRAETC